MILATESQRRCHQELAPLEAARAYDELLVAARSYMASDEPTIRLRASSSLIDAAIGLDDVDVLRDEAIPAAERCWADLESHDEGGDMAMAAYNLGNAYTGLGSLLSREQARFASLNRDSPTARDHHAALEQQIVAAGTSSRSMLARALRLGTSLPSQMKVRVTTNVAAAYRDEGRLFEALDTYEDALEVDPTHPIALAGAAESIIKIVRMRGAQDEGWLAMLTAREYLDRALEQPERAQEEGYDGVQNYHAAWSRVLDSLLEQLGGIERLKNRRQQWERDHATSPTEPSLEDQARLVLRFETRRSVCPDRQGDSAFFKHLNQAVHDGQTPEEMDTEFAEMSSFLSEAKEAYAAARHIFVCAEEGARPLPGSYDKSQVGRVWGLRAGLLKMALKSSVDVLDKLSGFLNLYWQLGIDEPSLHRVLSPDQPGPQSTSKALADQNRAITWRRTENPWTDALLKLAEGIAPNRRSANQSPLPFDAKDMRNAATHRVVKVTRHEDGSEGVSLVRLRSETRMALRLAKAAILYVMASIDHDSRIADQEDRSRPAHEIRLQSFFRVGSTDTHDHLSRS